MKIALSSKDIVNFCLFFFQRLLLGPTEILPGCISCRCYQDIEDPNAMLVVEEWESRADLEDHIAFENYRIILSLMELSVKLPEIKFNIVSRAEEI